MARNIRNISIKETVVEYGVVREGALRQYRQVLDTNSPRRILRELAAFEEVDPAQLVIIDRTERAVTYRVTDLVAMLDHAVTNGWASRVEDDLNDEVFEDAAE